VIITGLLTRTQELTVSLDSRILQYSHQYQRRPTLCRSARLTSLSCRRQTRATRCNKPVVLHKGGRSVW